MKKIFLTFTDEKMKKSRMRICKQAREIGVYDEILGYGEKDLHIEFFKKYSSILNSNTRGFGFWVWKPQIVKQKMMEMEYGDILHYVDAGCHFNLMGKKRLIEYFVMATKSKSGFVVFSPKEHPPELVSRNIFLDWPIFKYTKGDLLDYFNARHDIQTRESPMIVGTTFLIQKNAVSVDIVNKWSEISKHINLMDESLSVGGELPGFIQNMCDQSVLSLILNKFPVEIISNYEIEYPDINNKYKLDLLKMKDYPIHAKRDRGLSIISRAVKKFKRFIL